MASLKAQELNKLRSHPTYLGEYQAPVDSLTNKPLPGLVPVKNKKPIMSRTGVVYQRLPAGNLIRMTKKGKK